MSRNFHCLPLQLLFFCTFLGTNSQIAYNPTFPPNGCPNYGVCENVYVVNETSDGVDYYECASLQDCVCVAGVESDDFGICDFVNNTCSPTPCSTTAGQYFQCVPGVNSHQCLCQAGYTGTNCDLAVTDPCANNECQNGATCISNGTDTYSCQCPTDYMGAYCQNKNPCLSAQCTNNSTCNIVMDGAGYTCSCPYGYQGHNCRTKRPYWTCAPTFVGCYYWQSLLGGSQYSMTLSSSMTVDACEALLVQSVNPAYTYMTMVGQGCFLSTGNFLNNTVPPPTNNGHTNFDCTTTCPGNKSQLCGTYPYTADVYSMNCLVMDPNACDNKATCSQSLNQGACIDQNGTFTCICSPLYTGTNCETEIVSACLTGTPCQNKGNCSYNAILQTVHCSCPTPYYGSTCQYENVCNSSICLNGGTCTPNGNGFTCACLEYYSGSQCQDTNRCKYGTDPCNGHGTCTSTGVGVDGNYQCQCIYGWLGTNCDILLDLCATKAPCLNGGTCTPGFASYTCACVVGVNGTNCEDIIPHCVPTLVDGVWYANPCVTRDASAICNNEINGFTCNCSSQWTNELCDLSVVIEQVLISIYGSVDNQMLALLNDLLANPSQIVDMVPFIVGTLDEQERIDLSWSYEDMFFWAAFEQKRLDPAIALYTSNDVVLGNCFTFNHWMNNKTVTYKIRQGGMEGGFQTLMRIREDEYAPWYDRASIMVFIQQRGTYVMSESMRFYAEGNGLVELQIFDEHYSRLGGRYGVCVNSVSEVKTYYYDGVYTTDGCLRSCYQDLIYSKCNCMDPRYPMPKNTTVCALADRNCVDTASTDAGDPSTWKDCVCPSPCSERLYWVSWSRGPFVASPAFCATNSDAPYEDNCTETMSDTVMINVFWPNFSYQTFVEEPAMDFNTFVSYLGGLLGVLMGLSITSFIEFAFLFASLFMIMSSKR